MYLVLKTSRRLPVGGRLTRDAFKVVCKVNAPLLWLEMLVMLREHVVLYDHILDHLLGILQDHALQEPRYRVRLDLSLLLREHQD